jgi:hypothetical protein
MTEYFLTDTLKIVILRQLYRFFVVSNHKFYVFELIEGLKQRVIACRQICCICYGFFSCSLNRLRNLTQNEGLFFSIIVESFDNIRWNDGLLVASDTILNHLTLLSKNLYVLNGNINDIKSLGHPALQLTHDFGLFGGDLLSDLFERPSYACFGPTQLLN